MVTLGAARLARRHLCGAGRLASLQVLVLTFGLAGLLAACSSPAFLVRTLPCRPGLVDAPLALERCIVSGPFPGASGSTPTGRRGQRRRTAVHALDAEALANFASFSVLTGSPIPLVLSAVFRRAEIVASEKGSAGAVPTPPAASASNDSQVEPRDLMWAFPSFAVFLEGGAATAPPKFPMWARWLCLSTFWPGVVWYLYYKLAVEEDLRRCRGLGIGGYIVILPFAVGLFAGVFGEFAYGSLEGGVLDNGFSCAFYAAFAWIYLNQWFLYNKVNQLFEEEGRPAPLDPWGLLVPGWNFVTGIRQIHFLADYWARQQGRPLPRDAFAELFPFAKKPTLTLFELASSPALWIDLGSLVG